MAPSVLGIGIPASSVLVPAERKEGLQKALDAMEAEMQAAPYDWEMFYIMHDTPFDVINMKLHEKQWDVVLLGVGMRTIPPLIPLFEKIVNTVHVGLPKAKFAFNVTVEAPEEAIRRVLSP